MDILNQAHALIRGEREKDYGHPKQNIADIAALWSVLLHQPVSPAQVLLCMTALKLCRLSKSLDHTDSWVDAAGYIGLYGRLQEVQNVTEPDADVKARSAEVVQTEHFQRLLRGFCDD